MITEDDEWTCDLCEVKFSSEETLDNGRKNPDYADCYECNNCDNTELCTDCCTEFENADVILCKECLGIENLVTERVVEKIVEKPIYINQQANGIAYPASETNEEFEKRIMQSK